MCTIQKYLDTLSSSKCAVHLHEKAGFEQTERYNDNYTADIFMVLNLDNDYPETSFPGIEE